jgi:RHS repeat-associated protein
MDKGRILVGLWTASALATPAFAQEYTPPAPPPIRSTIDGNGVDLARGTVVSRSHSVSIGGPGAQGMSWSRTITSAGDYWDSTAIYLTSTAPVTVTIGKHTESFTLSGGNYISNEKTGATLVSSGGVLTFTSADGVVYTFSAWVGDRRQYSGTHKVTSVTYPTGERLTFNYELAEWCIDKPGFPCYIEGLAERLASVAATNGYRLMIEFVTNDILRYGDIVPWMTIAKVTAQNMSVDPASQTWPTLTLSGLTLFTDSLNRSTEYTFTSGLLTGVKRPGAAANNVTIAYTSGKVSQIVNDGVTTNYSYADLSNIRTTTIIDAAAGDRVVKTDLTTMLVSSDQDEAGKTTSYLYDANGLLTKVTAPEGNYATFQYDQRGNRKKTTLTPKSGSPLSPIVTQASYPASDATQTWRCATGTPAVTCNKPVTTTDAKSNVTNYVWDTTTGALSKVTLPAPATGGVRPETRYSYGNVYAQYLSGGSLVNFPTPVTRLTGISQCQTTASCTGLADEAKSTITNGTANALPVSVASGNGTGTLTATSAFTYDTVGNRLTVDGPLAGTADTTRTRYDLDRQVIGVVGPDPDGAGTLKNRAQRLTYNADGQVTKAEIGTVNGQSDADWAAFAPLAAVDVTYDSNARAVTQKLSSGGTAYALTQASYDSLGRVDCSAVRMNTAIYGSLPASACTLGTQDAFGPDRITKMAYDADSRPTKATVGYATSDAADERTLTYSDNGQVTTLKDAENNLTTIEYDGVDRVAKVRYPLPAKGANASSTTDYEQPTYDANGNVTAFRNRAVQTTNFTYDKLNRVTLKDLPGTEPDVTYAYDNLGRPTSASQTGNALSFGWDALSRKTSEGGSLGTTTFGYDLAGRRTSIVYPSTTALTINYAYMVTGELDTIKQSTTVLADYGYDNLGNRTSAVLGNGAAQAFSFDPVGRLSQLTNDLSGTTNDLTATFAYNPASQIASTVRTGDAYAWTGHGNGSTAYTQNGLNQQATVGGAAASWDTKGNLTTEPQSGKTYGYSSENLLTSASGGVTLSYDPALRLSQTVGAATTKFLYDGADAIAEYNGTGALQRRFIFDPTTGQPVLWYEGTGTAATNRRYLGQDERGSVISVSDSTSASLGLNTYDEYGKPGAANLGRYQYTGQKWIGEANIYDYKARDYVSQLGIFAQTDPARYTDSANLYAYVLDDPVNLVDPSGLLPMWCSAGGSPYGICSEYASSVYNWLTLGDPPGSRATDRDPNRIGAGGGGRPMASPKKRPPQAWITQCLSRMDANTKLALALDVTGVIASLTGLKATFEAGSFAVGTTASLLGLTLYGTEGDAPQKGLAGLGAMSTSIDISKAGGHPLAIKIAEAVPIAGAVVSTGVLAIDWHDAVKKAGC